MKLNKIAILCVSFLLTASCNELSLPRREDFNKNSQDVIDPDMRLNRADYRDMHAPRNLTNPNAPAGEPPIPDAVPNIRVEQEISFKPGNIVEPKIPDVAQIIAAPKPPKLGATKLVSVAVTEDVPLKDVLIELARLADVDIEVDASIYGGIAFRAKDRPFNEVVERIANLAGLRYNMRNNVLRVERDSPYIQVYPLDFINVDRTSTSNISVNSTGGSSSTSGSGGGAASSASGAGGTTGGTSNTSSSSITLESKNDFWSQLEKAIDGILKFNPARMASSTTQQAQPVVAPPPADGQPAPAVPAPAQVSITAPNDAPPFYILNRQAGTLTVSATERQHDIIKRYLSAMEKNVSSQVLIEAKIVEVTLNDRYQTGIEWAKFGTDNVTFSGGFNTVKNAATGATPASISILSNGIFGTNLDLSAAVQLLDEFGTARAISSPRLHAMNNQQAVLTFAENIIYFKVDLQVTAAVAGTGGSPGTPAQIEVTSTQNSVPVGLLLTLQPTINSETNDITLSVRPTLTKVIKFVPDPAYPIVVASALGQLTGTVPQAVLDKISASTNEVPQVETRELDSVLKVKSGQVMVIGGLLEDKVVNSDAGVPGLSEVPYVGNLFKSVDKQNSKKELVIFIRATTVSSTGSADAADKQVYEKFINDPRPLDF